MVKACLTNMNIHSDIKRILMTKKDNAAINSPYNIHLPLCIILHQEKNPLNSAKCFVVGTCFLKLVNWKSGQVIPLFVACNDLKHSSIRRWSSTTCVSKEPWNQLLLFMTTACVVFRAQGLERRDVTYGVSRSVCQPFV